MFALNIFRRRLTRRDPSSTDLVLRRDELKLGGNVQRSCLGNSLRQVFDNLFAGHKRTRRASPIWNLILT